MRRYTSAIIIAVTLLSCVFPASCAPDETDDREQGLEEDKQDVIDVPSEPETQNNKSAEDFLERAIRATVKLLVVRKVLGDKTVFGTCSGTFITPDGYILTNFHCVGCVLGEGDCETLKPGEIYGDGLAAVLPTTDPDKPPSPTYAARLTSADPTHDLAVFKIVGLIKSLGEIENIDPLPRGPANIVTAALGDSDKVKINDRVWVIGYPDLGGETITVTTGIISGRDDRTDDGMNDSFKTDADVNKGNSGGLATNAQGLQIGVPSWSLVDLKSGGKIDRLMMSNLAKPLIDQALAGDLYKAPAPAGTIVEGQILDADTGAGVWPATYVVLRPGITLSQWEANGNSMSMVAASAPANLSGSFQTPALPPGKYNDVVDAIGYRRDSGSLTLTGQPVMQLRPIRLQKHTWF